MSREARWTMLVAVGATALTLVVAIVTRDAWLFLLAAIGAAASAVVWGPRAPLE